EEWHNGRATTASEEVTASNERHAKGASEVSGGPRSHACRKALWSTATNASDRGETLMPYFHKATVKAEQLTTLALAVQAARECALGIVGVVRQLEEWRTDGHAPSREELSGQAQRARRFQQGMHLATEAITQFSQDVQVGAAIR